MGRGFESLLRYHSPPPSNPSAAALRRSIACSKSRFRARPATSRERPRMSALASSPVGRRWRLLADPSPAAFQSSGMAQEPVPPPVPPDVPPPGPAEVPPGRTPPDELPPTPPDELPPREDPPEIEPPPEDPPPTPDEAPEPPPQRVGRKPAFAGGYDDEWPNPRIELLCFV